MTEVDRYISHYTGAQINAVIGKAARGGFQDTLTEQTAYSSKGNKEKIPSITTNSLGQVTHVDEVGIVGSAEQNNTVEFSSNDWDSLKDDHFFIKTSIYIPTLDGSNILYNLNVKINNILYPVTLVRNSPSYYTGMFFVPESELAENHLYEITIYHNTLNTDYHSFTFRCATVY